MITLFQIIFILLSLIVFYSIFFKANKLFFAIYPYLFFDLFFGVFILIIINFIEIEIISFSLKAILAIVLLFSCYAFFQAEKNLSKKSEYQIKCEEYNNSLNWQNESRFNLVKDNITYNNQLELFFKEEDIFAEIFKLLKAAKKHIHLQFYIIRDDKVGQKLKKLLIDKTKSGVKVRIIYDGIGSIALNKKYIKALKQAGVEVGVYNSFVKSIIKGKLNNRLHRKLIIVDGKEGFSSDLNIGSEYIGENSRESIGFRLKGEIIKYMQRVFLSDWYYLKGEKIISKRYFHDFKKVCSTKMQLVNGSYDSQWKKIEQTYQVLIAKAKKNIYLVTPYITLSNNLVSALQIAALKGVEINIIVAKKTNAFLIDWANQSKFNELLKADINLYYYNKEFLHTKALIVDEKLMTFGSANFNSRSLYLDYETNIVLFEQEKTKKMLSKIKFYLKNSDLVNKSNYLAPSIKIKLQNIIGNLFAPFT